MPLVIWKTDSPGKIHHAQEENALWIGTIIQVIVDAAVWMPDTHHCPARRCKNAFPLQNQYPASSPSSCGISHISNPNNPAPVYSIENTVNQSKPINYPFFYNKTLVMFPATPPAPKNPPPPPVFRQNRPQHTPRPFFPRVCLFVNRKEGYADQGRKISSRFWLKQISFNRLSTRGFNQS